MSSETAEVDEALVHSQQVQATIYSTVLLFISLCFVVILKGLLNPLVHRFIGNKQPPEHTYEAPTNLSGMPDRAVPRSPESIGTHISRRPNAKGKAPPARSNPTTAALLDFAPKPLPKHYGLGAGEASSGEDDDREEELTSSELRRLQLSPQFRNWMKEKNITTGDLEQTARRLRLYRSLQRLHPASFWQLCNAASRVGVDTCAPTPLVLGIDYVMSLGLTLIAVAMCIYCWVHPLPGLVIAVWLGAAWLMCVRQWVQGRPAAGPSLGLWYEDLVWGHAVPTWRVITASLLEAAYTVSTLGLGAIISGVMRCRGDERQTVSERLLGIRAVKEVPVRLDT